MNIYTKRLLKLGLTLLTCVNLHGASSSAASSSSSSSEPQHISAVHAWAASGNLEALKAQGAKEAARKPGQKSSEQYDIALNINKPDTAGQYKQRTPLLLAALNYKNQHYIISFLLAKKANLYAKDEDGNNVLHLLAQRLIDERFAEHLFEYYSTALNLLTWEKTNALCAAKNNLGATPLHILAGHYRMKSQEEAKESRQTAKDNAGPEIVANPESEAKKFKLFSRAQELAGFLAKRCPNSVNAQDNNGMTPLHWAAYTHKPQIAKILMQNGAKPEITDNFGKTALHWAAPKASKELLNQILGYFEKLYGDGGAVRALNTKDARGRTPLHWIGRQMKGSTWYGHSFHIPIDYALGILEFFVNLGADASIKDQDGRTVGDWIKSIQQAKYPGEVQESIFTWLPLSESKEGASAAAASSSSASSSAASSSRASSIATSQAIHTNADLEKIKGVISDLISLSVAFKDVLTSRPQLLQDREFIDKITDEILENKNTQYANQALEDIAELLQQSSTAAASSSAASSDQSSVSRPEFEESSTDDE